MEATLPRLTEKSLKKHLNDVFAHHRKLEEPMWLQVHSVDFIETKLSATRNTRGQQESPSRARGGHTSTFHVTLSPAPENDAFDSDVFNEQGLRFICQMWHRHHNDDFLYDEWGDQCLLRSGTAQSNPTINPRYDQVNVYQPACNNRNSDTYGIIVGTPAQAVKHRRAFINLAAAIQSCLTPHLPKKLQGMDFFNHIGCRAGTFSGELKTKQRGQVPVVYLAASSRNNFETLLRSYNAFRAANRNTEILWIDNKIQILPMPKNQTTRTTTLEALKDIDQFYGSCVKIRLRPINIEATDEEWEQLQEIEEYVGLFPEYEHVDPDPESFTLYLRKTPDTHHLTTNTIRQHPGFPANILLPTLAAVAATPPSRNNNNNNNERTSPPSSSHTNRLLEFTDNLLRRNNHTNHNQQEQEDPDRPATSPTRTRDSPPGTPPPNKRSAPSSHQIADDDDDDPYADGTDWNTVANTAYSLVQTPTRQQDTEHNNDSKPPARHNTFAPLQEDEATDNNDHLSASDNNEEEEDDAEMLDADSDDLSRSLLPQEEDDDPGHHFSAPTGNEIDLIKKYVRHNNPSRLPELQQYLQHTTSFSNDTDAQDAWHFAQSLVQTGNASVADSRIGHGDPHAAWAKAPNE